MRRSTVAEAGLSSVTSATMQVEGEVGEAPSVSAAGGLGRDAVPPVGAADPVAEAAGAAGGVEAQADDADQDFLVALLAGDGEVIGGAVGEFASPSRRSSRRPATADRGSGTSARVRVTSQSLTRRCSASASCGRSGRRVRRSVFRGSKDAPPAAFGLRAVFRGRFGCSLVGIGRTLSAWRCRKVAQATLHTQERRAFRSNLPRAGAPPLADPQRWDSVAIPREGVRRLRGYVARHFRARSRA